MEDHSAGHIATEEAWALIEALQAATNDPEIGFYRGVSYRHLMTITGPPGQAETTPPHAILGRPAARYMFSSWLTGAVTMCAAGKSRAQMTATVNSAVNAPLAGRSACSAGVGMKGIPRLKWTRGIVSPADGRRYSGGSTDSFVLDFSRRRMSAFFITLILTW